MLTVSVTAILLGVASTFTVLCGYMGARPIDLRRQTPRMVPWRFLMMLGFTAALVLLVHLLNVLGFTTGQSGSY